MNNCTQVNFEDVYRVWENNKDEYENWARLHGARQSAKYRESIDGDFTTYILKQYVEWKVSMEG